MFPLLTFISVQCSSLFTSQDQSSIHDNIENVEIIEVQPNNNNHHQQQQKNLQLLNKISEVEEEHFYSQSNEDEDEDLVEIQSDSDNEPKIEEDEIEKVLVIPSQNIENLFNAEIPLKSLVEPQEEEKEDRDDIQVKSSLKDEEIHFQAMKITFEFEKSIKLFQKHQNQLQPNEIITLKAIYKQSIQGDCGSDQDLENDEVNSAWSTYKGIDSVTAKRFYVTTINNMLPDLQIINAQQEMNEDLKAKNNQKVHREEDPLSEELLNSEQSQMEGSEVDEEDLKLRTQKLIDAIENFEDDEMYDLITKTWDQTYKNADGETFLHLAIKLKNSQAVEFLINFTDTDFHQETDIQGQTPLHTALRVNASDEIITELIKEGSNDPNAMDKKGNSCLTLADDHQKEVIELALKDIKQTPGLEEEEENELSEDEDEPPQDGIEIKVELENEPLEDENKLVDKKKQDENSDDEEEEESSQLIINDDQPEEGEEQKEENLILKDKELQQEKEEQQEEEKEEEEEDEELIQQQQQLSVDQQFEISCIKVKTLEEVEQNQLLKLYGLFKQANIGNINKPEPWAYQYEAKAKWTAWNNNKGMEQDVAKQEYINIVKELQPDINLEYNEYNLNLLMEVD